MRGERKGAKGKLSKLGGILCLGVSSSFEALPEEVGKHTSKNPLFIDEGYQILESRQNRKF